MYLIFFYTNGWFNRYSILCKKIGSVKEKLDENQINKLREVQNSVSDEFKKYYSPLETFLHSTDLLFEVNERDYSLRKRRELSARLMFNIIFLAIWRFLIDENIL